MLLKFNNSELVAANARARNHNKRSYWISNFPERNSCNKMKPIATRDRFRKVSPKGNEKRCRNSAEASNAMSIRVADLSDLYVGRTDPTGVSANIQRPRASRGTYRTIFRCQIRQDAVDRGAYRRVAAPAWSRIVHPARQLASAMTVAQPALDRRTQRDKASCPHRRGCDRDSRAVAGPSGRCRLRLLQSSRRRRCGEHPVRTELTVVRCGSTERPALRCPLPLPDGSCRQGRRSA